VTGKTYHGHLHLPQGFVSYPGHGGWLERRQDTPSRCHPSTAGGTNACKENGQLADQEMTYMQYIC